MAHQQIHMSYRHSQYHNGEAYLRKREEGYLVTLLLGDPHRDHVSRGPDQGPVSPETGPESECVDERVQRYRCLLGKGVDPVKVR